MNKEDELWAIVDVLIEAEKTADEVTVLTRWHHAAEALQQAGYAKVGPVEMEYALEETRSVDEAKRIAGRWTKWLENAQGSKKLFERGQKPYAEFGGKSWYTYRIVQQPKPEAYTYVEEED